MAAKKFKIAAQLIHNMGWKYIFFRLGFEFKKRTGLLQASFPTDSPLQQYYTLKNWRESELPFFFNSKESLNFSLPLTEKLKKDQQKLADNVFSFFSSLEFKLQDKFKWITNPDTGYRYDPATHWVNIDDYSETAGDIKYAWEISRFSHLYTLIRYDKHSGSDCSKRVFNEIESWIDSNKINCGPNFKCSQEIALRLMNWIFALHYYRNSADLTDDIFNKIQHYIYWQTHHIYNNINFSRIAVRNNHALTETLGLFIIGTLFPNFPGAAKWKCDGKKWFEEEIAYQIYEDGTFLQFSMNYHRVAVQLLTWGLQFADLHNDRFNNVVYDRALKSVKFLSSAMNKQTGWLPNYGANDGALFFKLNDNHYRDYRPQLEALSYALNLEWDNENFEDALWYGLQPGTRSKKLKPDSGYTHFNIGGYYTYRSADSLTFIRCGNHKDRPSQADNLHLDVWYKNMNILHDAGSYKYNSSPDDIKYFMGTRSHNTVMLGNNDQMEKGNRFVWFNWTQCKDVKATETDDHFYFEGTISAFGYISKSIFHTRRLVVHKKNPLWEVEDTISNKPPHLELTQLWHTRYMDILSFKSKTLDGEPITAVNTEGYVSDFYGKKETCDEITFATMQDSIKTVITIK